MKVFFDHAAVATHQPEQFKQVLGLLGLKFTGSEDVSSQGVRTHFLKPDPSDLPSIEVLEVLDPNGVVQKFIDKKGSGIHHLSFRVQSDNKTDSAIDAITEKLRLNGIRLIYESAKDGAHHTRVNFIHPSSCGGVLIEISEQKS